MRRAAFRLSLPLMCFPGLRAGAYPDAMACEALWEVYCETGDAGSALQLASDSLRAHIPVRYVESTAIHTK